MEGWKEFTCQYCKKKVSVPEGYLNLEIDSFLGIEIIFEDTCSVCMGHIKVGAMKGIEEAKIGVK